MARIKSQSHRVTETRRITQVKALRARNISPARSGAQTAMEGMCLNAHRKGTGAMGIGALAVGTSILAASEAKTSEKSTNIMFMEQEDVQMKTDIQMSPEVSAALAVAAMVSAASTLFFGIRAYKTRRKVPGIIGPSGLVPLSSRKDEGNPFRNEGVSDDEYARIRKETHVWGKKKRKERYMFHMDANNMEVSLNPTDFKFTFNKNTLPLLASIGAILAFSGLYLAGKEYSVKNTAEPAKIEQKDSSAQ